MKNNKDKPNTNNSTNKELLKFLVEYNRKQLEYNERQDEYNKKHSEDIREIKSCLKGDKYHKHGLVDEVNQNKKCIDDIKKKRLPEIEKMVEKRSSIIGGFIAVITVVATTVANWWIFGGGSRN